MKTDVLIDVDFRGKKTTQPQHNVKEMEPFLVWIQFMIYLVLECLQTMRAGLCGLVWGERMSI